MKRKFKLFATVASLCLSVALMAFGVYAATSATYNVNSTVSFDAINVAVEWKGNAYKDTERAATWEAENTYTTNGVAADQPTGTWKLSEITFDASNAVVMYEFACTNNGNAPVNIGVTASGLTAIEGQFTVEVYEGSGTDLTKARAAATTDLESLDALAGVKSLATNNVYVCIITVELIDFTRPFTSQTLAASFVTAPVSAPVGP